MNFRLESVLSFVIGAAIVFLFMTYLGQHNKTVDCGPVALTPEVKAYIDSRSVASVQPQCADLPKMVSKLADLEVRMGAMDTLRQLQRQRQEKADQSAAATQTALMSVNDLLTQTRLSEARKFKEEIANLCMSGGERAHSPSKPEETTE